MAGFCLLRVGLLGVVQKLTSLCTCRPTTSMRSRTGTGSCSGGSDVVLFVIGVLRLWQKDRWENLNGPSGCT